MDPIPNPQPAAVESDQESDNSSQTSTATLSELNRPIIQRPIDPQGVYMRLHSGRFLRLPDSVRNFQSFERLTWRAVLLLVIGLVSNVLSQFQHEGMVKRTPFASVITLPPLTIEFPERVHCSLSSQNYLSYFSVKDTSVQR